MQHRPFLIGLLGTNRTRHATVTPRFATTAMAVVRTTPTIGVAKTIVNRARARGDARLLAAAARTEAVGHRSVGDGSKRLTRQQHRGAHADPRTELGMQQQARHRRHNAKASGLGEMLKVQSRSTRVDKLATHPALRQVGNHRCRSRDRQFLDLILGHRLGNLPALPLELQPQRTPRRAQNQDGSAVALHGSRALLTRLATVKALSIYQPDQVKAVARRLLLNRTQQGHGWESARPKARPAPRLVFGRRAASDKPLAQTSRHRDFQTSRHERAGPRQALPGSGTTTKLA